MAKVKMNKIVAIVFVFLMVGSSVSYGIITLFRSRENQDKIPTERIIDYRLSDRIRQELLSRGYTLVEYSYPSDCFDCGAQKLRLEDLTSNSDNQIFLQELSLSDATLATVTIISYKGQETLYNPSDQEIQDKLCELLLARPLFCVQV